MKLNILKPDRDTYFDAAKASRHSKEKSDYAQACNLAEQAIMTATTAKQLFIGLIELYFSGSKDAYCAESLTCGDYTIRGNLASVLLERRRYLSATFPKLVLYILLSAAMFCLTAMILFYPPVVSFIDGFVTYDNLMIILTILMFIAFFAAGVAGIVAYLVVVAVVVWLVTEFLTEAMILLIGTWGFRIMLSLIPILIAKSGFFHNIKYHSRSLSKGKMVRELTAECTNYANTLLLLALWAEEEAKKTETWEIDWQNTPESDALFLLLKDVSLPKAIDFAIGYYKSVLDECK